MSQSKSKTGGQTKKKPSTSKRQSKRGDYITKESIEAIANQEIGTINKPKLYAQQRNTRDSGYRNYNGREDALIAALDHKNTICRFADLIEKARDGKTDVASFFHGVAPEAAVQLVSIALSSNNEKTKLAALEALLDRAGYNKVQKHAIIGSVDPTASKEELISSIFGMSKKMPDIEIVDDDIED